MKRFILSILLIAAIVAPLSAATTNKIHDFATGIMHSADTISFTPTVEITSTNVQEAISGVGSTYATKAYVNGTDENIINTFLPLKANITYVNGTDETIINTYLPLKASITYVNGTDENIINTLLPAKANASYVTGSTETALLTHTGNSTNPHGMTISNLPTLSGTNTFTGTNNFTGPVSLTDGTNTSTIIPPFRTDKSKCELLVDFDNSLVDKTRGITPTGYSTANMWSNGWVNDTIAVGTATNLGGTFKTFNGDRGKFGGGIAVEEARTNHFVYSDSLTTTSSGWTHTGVTVTLDRVLADGRNLYKIAGTTGSIIRQVLTPTGGIYTQTWFLMAGDLTSIKIFQNDDFINTSPTITNTLTRYTLTGHHNTSGGGVGLKFLGNGYIYACSPQLEAGSFATSYIATTSAAVTRPVGVLSYSFPNTLSYNSAFSYSFWIQENSQAQYGKKFTINKASGSFTYTIFRKTASSQTFTIRANEDTGVDFTMPSFDTNWHLWTFTSDGTTFKVYVDATLVTSRAVATADTAPYTGVNASGGGGSSVLNNFVMLNYCLTAAEIKQIYYSNQPVMCEGAVKKDDITRTFAGDPNNDFAPMYLNEMVWDSTNSKWYKSKGVLSNAAFDTGAWILLN